MLETRGFSDRIHPMMLAWCKLALVVFSICAPVWAQSSSAPAQEDKSDTRASQPAQASTDSAKESSTGQTSAGLNPADSVKLEILKSKKAAYPLDAERQGIQGEVVLKVLISEDGDVESAEVLSGDPILAKSALDAVKKWKFKPFIRNGKAVKVSTKLPFDFYFKDKVIEKGVSADLSATSNYKGLQPAPANIPNPNAAAPTVAPPNRLRVASGVTQGMLIHQVAPVYPLDAKRSHIEGTVVLGAVIGKDGRIQDLRAISGPKELVPAALGAVQQWRYKPYLLMGNPVEVETHITVNFRLNR